MAGVDALGGAVTWPEIGAILAALGSFGTALFGIAHAKAKIEENGRQIEVLMVQMQKKAERDDVKDAITDLRGYIKDVRADFKDGLNQVANQIGQLSGQIANMQKTRSHSSG
jgi:hypothetical protein